VNVNQAPAFDDAGEITDLLFFTDGWFREQFGIGITTPLCVFFCCNGKRLKRAALPSITAAALVISTYAAPFTVIGSDIEGEYCDALRKVFDIAATIPFPLPREKL